LRTAVIACNESEVGAFIAFHHKKEKKNKEKKESYAYVREHSFEAKRAILFQLPIHRTSLLIEDTVRRIYRPYTAAVKSFHELLHREIPYAIPRKVNSIRNAIFAHAEIL